MSSPSTRTRRPGRGHLAALSAAALLGATVAGTASGVEPSPDVSADTADRGGIGVAEASAETLTDQPPQPVTVDATLVSSVARQVLLEQEQPVHLTDVDLIARDVLAQNPADAGEVDRMTRETLVGNGPAAPPANGEPAPPQCPPTARACIDVDGKRAWMVDDGHITYGPVPVTTGRPGHETVRGPHNVIRHVRHDHSIPFDSPMPYSTYFTASGIAFHEGRLDEPSHGCIHLGHHAAAHFFENLEVGDEVVAF